jgi:rhamnose transport system permease protein
MTQGTLTPSSLPTITRERFKLLAAAGRVLRGRESAIFLAFALVTIAATAKNPTFLFSVDGWRDLLLTPSVLILLAVGEAVVIITRNVDLSVGSVLGLSTWICGQAFIAFPNLPVPVVFVIGAVAGALMGTVNGVVVGFFKVPALVVTLGTLYIFRGITVLWAGSGLITAGELPAAFTDLGTSSLFTIPWLSILALIVVGIAAWYLKNIRAGRELYAIGSDPAAAKLYGLPTTKRVISTFILSGALAGVAGVVSLSRYATASSQSGSGLELQAVAAAVIGGVAIFGGSGTIIGAVIGAVLLVTINRALPVLGIQDFWQQAVVGTLIIGAILLDRLLLTRRTRKLTIAEDSVHV